MRYKIRTVTPLDQVTLAVAVDEAKAFMKVEGSAEDDVIDRMLRDAQAAVEDFTGQVLTERSFEMILCGFPALPELISLPRDPVTEISSIAYTDPSTGEAVTMDSAAWRWADTAPDQLLPAWRQSWPSAAAEMGSVRVRFVAGYEAGLCPTRLSEAVKKAALRFYDDRDCEGLSEEMQRSLRSFRPLLA